MESGSGTVLTLGVGPDVRRAIGGVGSIAAVEAEGVRTRLSEDRPSCVVLGHEPPEVDAVEVVQRVAAADPVVPVVVFAAADDDSLGADVVASGAARYVPRRRGPEELRDAVEAVIQEGNAVGATATLLSHLRHPVTWRAPNGRSNAVSYSSRPGSSR